MSRRKDREDKRHDCKNHRMKIFIKPIESCLHHLLLGIKLSIRSELFCPALSQSQASARLLFPVDTCRFFPETTDIDYQFP